MTHECDKESSAPGKLAIWEFAGLLLTYWCNARCAFCYVYSGPDRGGEMSVEFAVKLWSELDRLAATHGKTMRIHLAGGEPFGNWARLAGVMRAARDAGLTFLEKIETNAFWATDDNVVRTRLELLNALGMQRLIVSADVYHQEFIPFARVQRLVDGAREVLGGRRYIVRWWDFYNHPREVRGASVAQRDAAFAEALAHQRERLTGRAALRLARLLPRSPAESFAGENCRAAVLQSRHVHIDAYGNIFPGTCGGIILGCAAQRAVDDVWHELAANWREHPVVAAVVAGGSYELVRQAQAFGYSPRADGYADKCHLCTDVRQFLVERGIWPEYIGPRECYANDADKREQGTGNGEQRD